MEKLSTVLNYTQPTNYIVKDEVYNDEYSIPVLTAGKSFLLGYTNEKKGIFTDVPTIIFDDFTTSFHYVDFPFKVKSSAMKMLTPKRNDVHLKYVYYQMLGKKVDTRRHKRYWISQFSKLKIPLPSLPIQQKIASILDDAAALRDKTEQLLTEYDLLAQSIFLEMFGDPLNNTRKWKKFAINELGVVTTGSTPPSKLDNMFDGPIPFVTPGDLDSDEEYKRTVTEEGAKRSRMVGKNALLVCCIGATIGKRRRVKENVAFNQQINAIEWNEKINPIFGDYVFDWVKFEVVNRAILTTLPILKKSLFEQIECIVPPIDLQNQFAEKVQLIERQKEIVRQELKESEDLFQALLQQAFKGELV